MGHRDRSGCAFEAGGAEDTGSNALVRELGKSEGLLEAARVVDRGVEVAGVEAAQE